MQHLIEGTTPFATDSEEKISRKMPIFYNPVMKLNRDLSLLVMRTLREPRIALPMEASGIRAARILHELVDERWAPQELLVNDIAPGAVDAARQNAERVRKGFSAIAFTVMPAQRFLRERAPFDYIDIDPFGTPNPFLDAAAQSLRRGGILAVTATDTSALAGTYPKATERKYWSVPSRSWIMHDAGLRILVRKTQLVAAQYDIALSPVLCVSCDHYYRIFLRAAQGAGRAHGVLAQHAFLHVDSQQLIVRASRENAAPVGMHAAGPLWAGQLHDATLVEEMIAHASALGSAYDDARALLEIIKDECRIPEPGFIDVHKLSALARVQPPRRDALLRMLGDRACRTHISPTGIKTNIATPELVRLVQEKFSA
jgi:tRNA (guanine26-N2/guanine27-N2)-dimethyltransferase